MAVKKIRQRVDVVESPSKARIKSDTAWDVIVVGSGAGGLSAALTAATLGLRVLVLEKEEVFGGTTARSGGVLWIPGNGKFPDGQMPADADPRAYLRDQAGNAYDEARVSAFLEAGPRMVRFMEERTSAVRFIPAHGFSDYHPEVPGSVTTGRSIAAEPYDGTALGAEVRRLRPPLAEITLMGMMLNASQDVKHFFNATKSFASFRHVARLISKYGYDLVRHRRAMRLTNGNALIARLARSLFDLGIEIRTGCGVAELVMCDGRVCGVRTEGPEDSTSVHARYGVVLAAGGFPQEAARKRALFRHELFGGEHLSPAPAGNTGDGIALAESVGGQFSAEIANPAALIPVSRVPDRRRLRIFPHLIDRYKPGVIMINRHGKRFVNESNSYHDVGQAMQADALPGEPVFAWLIADHRSIRKYGLGFAKPAPFLLSPYIRSGYLKRGRTVAALATEIAVDPRALEATIAAYNGPAAHGEDPAFGRGSSAYNRYLGDPEHRPNPCVAPLANGPFYAIRLVLGDLGTFAGIKTDDHARVVRADGTVVAGLYAVGNDALSIMGGNYPGGGITLGPAMTFGFLAAEDLLRISRETPGTPSPQSIEAS